MNETGNRYKDIAPRLKGLRDALDLSPEELAAQTGVSPADVLRYESGETEIPVGFLVSVSQACGVDLTTLVTGGEAHLHGYCHTPKGKGLAVERRKDYDYKSLAYTFGGRRMEPFLITVPPKDASQLSFNSHPGQEFIHMLSGRLEITLDNKKFILAQGDSFYFSSSIPHALRGLDDQEAVFIDVLA